MSYGTRNSNRKGEWEMRIIVCGPRRGVRGDDVWDALDRIQENLYVGEEMVVVTGGNFEDVTSADALAHAWAYHRGLEPVTFEADWDRYGAAAGPKRNRKMAEAGADLCLAFGRICKCGQRPGAHMTHGTASMVNEAIAELIEVRIVPL